MLTRLENLEVQVTIELTTTSDKQTAVLKYNDCNAHVPEVQIQKIDPK